ncbi:MAG: chorismate synthase [Paludibacteraceae bacterium]|nr:chorismate synthase [Paludibacteraceae bacterium]
MNTFGNRFRFTSFGESHGAAVGGVVDGCPGGISLDMALIEEDLEHRKPTASWSTARHEADQVEFLSGLYNGKTLGSPIAFILRNTDCRTADYNDIADIYRPGHADHTYEARYGIRAVNGGGRASARETAARVVAGSIAKMLIRPRGIQIHAYTSQIGTVCLNVPDAEVDYSRIYQEPTRCPDHKTSKEMEALLDEVRKNEDSVGGAVTCVISGLPAGLGNPIFGKVQSLLAAAMMSINACKGFEYGTGFASAVMHGSELNDPYAKDAAGHISPLSNRAGGLLGGITNGHDIIFRCAFKPTPSIGRAQRTCDADGVMQQLRIRGRHDTCVVPRAVSVVEAMAAMVIADLTL